ncbi:HetP family heterocyst commitment protein [Lyngbya aestuarii]|uniref:HetP family heterocyst commitment protein n=1 Tax=Lyngbya aestuarii TaxID=118322 RepID=UPI00403D9F28
MSMVQVPFEKKDLIAMTMQISYSNRQFNKEISPEQFDQIIEAILAGKYSWACVLMLRFAGYNPLHYIPYRTHNRLIKENSQVAQSSLPKLGEGKKVNHNNPIEFKRKASQKCVSKITDLSYLEPVEEKNTRVRGGSLKALSGSGEIIPWKLREILT